MEYRRVTVTGQYDFEHQVALRNRYYKTENANQPGYHLVTPLVLQDGTAILVERGWIPYAGNPSPEEWRAYDQPGQVTISGILRLGQATPDVGGVPDPTLVPGQTRLDFWNLINVERIASQLPYPVLLVYVQPDPQARPEPPYPYQPEIEITEGPHMGYALQWFTFAAILFIGYPFYVRSQNELETR
jgi:surfeit locus 1 family protein